MADVSNGIYVFCSSYKEGIVFVKELSFKEKIPLSVFTIVPVLDSDRVDNIMKGKANFAYISLNYALNELPSYLYDSIKFKGTDFTDQVKVTGAILNIGRIKNEH